MCLFIHSILATGITMGKICKLKESFKSNSTVSFTVFNTVKPVYSGHPSGPKQLAVIERWLDYTM